MPTLGSSPIDRLASLARREGALWLDTSSTLGSPGPWTTFSAEPAVWILGRGEELQVAVGPRGDRGWADAVQRMDPHTGSAYDRLACIWRCVQGAPDGNPESTERTGTPRFEGGLAGYFGYDLGRTFEDVPEHLEPDLPWDFVLGLYDEVLNIRLDTGEVRHSGLRSPDGSAPPRHLFECWRLPEKDTLEPVRRDVVLKSALVPGMTRDDHAACVRRIREHIVAGDIYQANLTLRFRGDWTDPDLPLATHLRLRSGNPSPYGAYVDLPAIRIVSASPEGFLSLSADGRVASRPIKGTRGRGRGDEDDRLRDALLGSEKDHAELAMIVDLVRNDLGRVCVPGSITRFANIVAEAHPTVWHLVGEVTGRLEPTADAFDLLRAAFPPGSCIGAPKIRAMQILEGLERSRRGVYTGGLGWIGVDGSMATSVAIRTMTFHAERVEYGVGGGIVYDSDEDLEWEEALLKGRALARALTGSPAADSGNSTGSRHHP